MNNPIERSSQIRRHNDQFRTSLRGGSVLITAGVIALGEDIQSKVLAAVQAYSNFDEGNDPWCEHDFGAVEVCGQRLFFKIDYYDPSRSMDSLDPSDPDQTERVMTIMLAAEY